MKAIVVVEKDMVGLLADIADVLGKAKVNIDSVSADVAGKSAVVRLFVSDEKKGTEALRKAGFKPVASDTVVALLPDEPGELSRMARMLSEAGIGMTNVYHLGKSSGKALVAIKVGKKDFAKAQKLLANYA